MSIRIVCEVEVVGESLTGHAISSGGTRDFTGWLGFMGALQDLVAAAQGAAAADTGLADPNEEQPA